MTRRPDTPDGIPWKVPATYVRPDLTRTASRDRPVQVWHDAWRHEDRILRFMGRCLACGIPTFSFDDGQNDPRGILGNSAYWPVDLQHHGVEYELTTCSVCANDGAAHRRARQLARTDLDYRQRGHASQYRSTVTRRLEPQEEGTA